MEPSPVKYPIKIDFKDDFFGLSIRRKVAKEEKKWLDFRQIFADCATKMHNQNI
jgi:hypothetical protein